MGRSSVVCEYYGSETRPNASFIIFLATLSVKVLQLMLIPGVQIKDDTRSSFLQILVLCDSGKRKLYLLVMCSRGCLGCRRQDLGLGHRFEQPEARRLLTRMFLKRSVSPTI